MSGLVMDAAETERFTAICRVASLRTSGGGLTLAQLGDAGALAREMESPEPDSERVEQLAARLAVDPEELMTDRLEGAR